MASVDADARTVMTGASETLAFDSLLTAVGARSEPDYRHAITFGAEVAREALSGLSDLQLGYGEARRVRGAQPRRLEPAAQRAGGDDRARRLERTHRWRRAVLRHARDRPLEAFGAEAAAMVGQEGIVFIGSTFADVGHGFVLAGGRRIGVDRTLALPVPSGPGVPGLPPTSRA